jgi:adenylate kinase
MRIILLGPPGAGKGTQALQICKKHSLEHISTGEIMRELLVNDNELSNKVRSFYNAGSLVPDEIVIEIIKEKLKNCHKFVSDGFPRTVNQAQLFNTMLSMLNLGITHIFDIIVPEEILLERIKKRSSESANARIDDSDQVAVRRLEVYRKETAPIKDFYSSLHTVHEINGLGSVDEVSQRIEKYFS